MAVLGLNRSTAYPLPIGQMITFVAEKDSDELEYVSRIEDVLDTTVLVSMPMRQRSFIAPPKDTNVSAFFNLDGARYSFRAVVRGQMEEPLPMLFLADVCDVRKQERRAFVRVSVIIEPELLVYEEDDLAQRRPKDAFIVDIGGGGLGLVSRQPMKPGGFVEVRMDLPRGFGPLAAKARVAWTAPLTREGLPKWKVGLCFVDLGPKDRDRITAFVLQHQQELRRRGLI
jgi:c-di-GMP-binding flagellar brake protein YcgR